MLTTERYPQANNDCKDRTEEEKTWDKWKTDYKKAGAKALIKIQAAKGVDRFVAANAAERVVGVSFNKNSGGASDNGGDEVVLTVLKGYFNNLAAATTNNKTVLEQLLPSSAKIAATNEELVAVIKNEKQQ